MLGIRSLVLQTRRDRARLLSRGFTVDLSTTHEPSGNAAISTSRSDGTSPQTAAGHTNAFSAAAHLWGSRVWGEAAEKPRFGRRPHPGLRPTGPNGGCASRPSALSSSRSSSTPGLAAVRSLSPYKIEVAPAHRQRACASFV